jgi:hypothetical protein
MYLVHICATRYARPFKSNNKHCKIFPFDDTKSAFAFADWWLKGSPVCVRIENYQALDEELAVQAKDNSDVILMALQDEGALEDDDINDCSFVT